ncbi:MAG: hypothetical protein WCP97_00545 [bacterium]
MAEQTLTQKIASALARANFTYTTDEATSLVNDALREFSLLYPRLLSSTTTTDGVKTSYTLPTGFLSLDADTYFSSPLHPSGVVLNGVDVYEHERSIERYSTTLMDCPFIDPTVWQYPYNLYGVIPASFWIVYEAIQTIEFYTAPSAGSFTVYYNGLWDATTINPVAHKAVVLLSLHFAKLESKGFSSDVKSVSEGGISITYKGGQEDGAGHYQQAVDLIKKLPGFVDRSKSYVITPARRA